MLERFNCLNVFCRNQPAIKSTDEKFYSRDDFTDEIYNNCEEQLEKIVCLIVKDYKNATDQLEKLSHQWNSMKEFPLSIPSMIYLSEQYFDRHNFTKFICNDTLIRENYSDQYFHFFDFQNMLPSEVLRFVSEFIHIPRDTHQCEKIIRMISNRYHSQNFYRSDIPISNVELLFYSTMFLNLSLHTNGLIPKLSLIEYLKQATLNRQLCAFDIKLIKDIYKDVSKKVIFEGNDDRLNSSYCSIFETVIVHQGYLNVFQKKSYAILTSYYLYIFPNAEAMSPNYVIPLQKIRYCVYDTEKQDAFILLPKYSNNFGIFKNKPLRIFTKIMKPSVILFCKSNIEVLAWIRNLEKARYRHSIVREFLAQNATFDSLQSSTSPNSSSSTLVTNSTDQLPP